MVAFIIFAALAAVCRFISIILLEADLNDEGFIVAVVGLFLCIPMVISIPFIQAPAKKIPAYTSTIEPYTFVAEPLVWIEKEKTLSLEP